MTAAQPEGPTPGKLLGQRVKRKEDPRLLQGRATFVDDVQLPGMLHVAFKRSYVPHGRIARIDTSTAEAMPGVELVMTGAELKEILAPQPVLSPFPHPDHWSIAPEKVNYVGDPVAVVVASDRYLARDAADAIEVEIDELPAVVAPEQAMLGKPTVIHEAFDNNLAAPLVLSGTGVNLEDGSVDDSLIADAFAKAELLISQRMVNHRLAPSAMEARGIVAHFEPDKEQLTVWFSGQSAHWAKSYLTQYLDLSDHQVRVITPEVGGGFGAKIALYGEGYVTAALSKQLGRPLKWIEDRSEAFLATTHGRDLIGYVDLAAKRDGTLLGLKVRIIADIGAYQMLHTTISPSTTQGMLSGTYNIPAIRATLTLVFTNKTPTDAYRGAGRPEGIYFVERAIDLLARELDMDPAEVRRKNFIQPDQFPFHSQAGNVYDSGDYERLLDKALALADWESLKAERNAARCGGRLVGIGMAFYIEVGGFGPSALNPGVGGWEYASVTIERSGKITATTGASSHGQGHETTFAQLLADEFGLPLDHISVLHGDTAVAKQGLGTFASRSQAVGGTALQLAAQKVKKKMARFAAHMLERPQEEILFTQQQLVMAGAEHRPLPFTEVAAYAYAPPSLPPDTEPGLSDEAFWEPDGATVAYGCYIVQVEIDRETGEIDLQKLFGVDDCGTIINPLIVEGQIHGGLAQGIGQALLEEVVYDEDGQLVTGSFLDYAIPRASDLPRFVLSHTVTPTPLNPLGAKGSGEAGAIGSTPAVVNAVVDALSEFGVTHVDMMLRPEKIWRILRGNTE